MGDYSPIKRSNDMATTRAEVIWDRDHGAFHEGWYLRDYDGETHCDYRLDAMEDLPRDTAYERLALIASEYLDVSADVIMVLR